MGGPSRTKLALFILKKGPVAPKLFTYMRYNAELTKAGLAALGIGDIQPKEVQQLDSIEHITDLQRVGKAVARQCVRLEHFSNFL